MFHSQSGIGVAQGFVETFARVALVEEVVLSQEYLQGFVVITHGRTVIMGLAQERTHLIAGDAQGVQITTFTQTGDGLFKGLSGLVAAMQTYQCRCTFDLADGHFVLTAQFLLHLIGLGGIVERLLVIAQVVIHLAGHAMQHGHTLQVIHLLGIADAFQDIFLGFAGLAHTHIDTCQRIER